MSVGELPAGGASPRNKEGRMGSNNEFLTEEELKELRSEIEGLGRQPLKAPAGGENVPEGQLLSEIIDETNSKLLTLEENGSYVKVSNDNMTAWLYLAEPGIERDNYTMDELMDFLKKEGVVTGFHHSNLAAMIRKKVYEREIVVAQGQPAIEGNNGYYEYKFDVNQRRAPKVLENGRVDYTNMSSLENVHEGDVVAIYHHAKEGKDGFDIRGRVQTVKGVKEIPPLTGKAIGPGEDPDVYIALQDGKIGMKNGKIDIQALHEINGDVTLITGKVEFFGDVVISGGVESGVVIRAGRNIEIRGNVEAVSLYAGGDIILGRGIQGGQRAKIIARGDIYADFLEHTVAVAGGNVQANTILNSRVSADGQIILTGKKGAIIGGYNHAMMGITATEIGNPAEIRTVVHVGCEKEVYQKVQQLRITDAQQEEALSEARDEYMELAQRKKKAGKLSDALEIKLQTLESRYNDARKDLDVTRKELRKLEDQIARGQGSEIQVNGNVYRGTVVCLAQVQMPIERDTCFMKYYQQKGMIESKVLAYSS